MTLVERKAARAIVAAYSDFWTQVSCMEGRDGEGGEEGEAKERTYLQKGGGSRHAAFLWFVPVFLPPFI